MKALRPLLIFILASSAVHADWRTDIGWDNLQEWALINNVTLPDTSTVPVGMTESPFGENNTIYAPDATNAQLSDVTITEVSGDSLSPSGHATGVASTFFGNSSSVSADVSSANIYSFNDFILKIQNITPSNWTEKVMSHAYVSTGTLTAADTKFLSERLDETSTDSGILHIVGMSNSAGASIPYLWGHMYNGISVGVSDGGHSYGTIQSGYEGAGRQKPEVVNPQSTTSSATGATASVATLLRARAENHSSTNAVLPVVIKTCILAGANKSKFSDWDNTPTRPIDDIYGAGETDILSSYLILNEDESPVNTSVNRRGWDYHIATSGSNYTYTFTVPSNSSYSTVSTNISWNRTISTTRVKGQLVTGYDTLADFSLTLKDSLTNEILFVSNSEFDNLEHIWQTKLAPGDYTLEVSQLSGSDTPYALAWIVDVATISSPASITHGATSNDLVFADLAPEHKYIVQRSSDLNTWTDVQSDPIFSTSDISGSLNFSDPNESLGEKVFYRLRYYSP